MTSLTHRIETKAAPEALWEVLTDLLSVARTNPGVASVRLLPGPAGGPGARRECLLRPKGRLVERVTAWEQGRSLAMEVAESDGPIARMAWTTRIEPAPAGAVLLQRLDYRLRFGPLGWLLDRLLMRRMIGRAVAAALAGAVAEAEGRR